MDPSSSLLAAYLVVVLLCFLIFVLNFLQFVGDLRQLRAMHRRPTSFLEMAVVHVVASLYGLSQGISDIWLLRYNCVSRSPSVLMAYRITVNFTYASFGMGAFALAVERHICTAIAFCTLYFRGSARPVRNSMLAAWLFSFSGLWLAPEVVCAVSDRLGWRSIIDMSQSFLLIVGPWTAAVL